MLSSLQTGGDGQRLECLATSVEVFADIVPRTPLEVAVIIRFDVRVNGPSNALTIATAMASADAFQRLISPARDQGPFPLLTLTERTCRQRVIPATLTAAAAAAARNGERYDFIPRPALFMGTRVHSGLREQRHAASARDANSTSSSIRREAVGEAIANRNYANRIYKLLIRLHADAS